MWLILKNVLNNLEPLKHRNGEEDKVQDVGRMIYDFCEKGTFLDMCIVLGIHGLLNK